MNRQERQGAKITKVYAVNPARHRLSFGILTIAVPNNS